MACLNSLRSVTTPHDVILVDNASTDDTVGAVSASFPAVRILQSGWNAGFAEGNNLGLRLASEDGYGIIGLLNNDTIVRPDFLEPLVRHLQENPGVAVSPRIEYRPARSHP